MTFLKRMRRLNSFRRPLRTRDWVVVITLFIGVMTALYAAYVLSQTVQLYAQLEAQERKAAQRELNAAVENTLQLLNQQIEKLTAWQELRAQFQDPSYYFYWREQALPTSRRYPQSLLEVELYGPDRHRLAGVGNPLKYLDDVLPPMDILWVSDGQHLTLIRYATIQDDSGQTLGHAGFAFDFLDALRRNNTFQHLKPDQIQIVGVGRFLTERIHTLLKADVQPDLIAKILIERFQSAFVWLLVLLFTMIAFLWVMQYLLQGRSYNTILTTLKRIHQANRPLPFPSRSLPIRELNQLLHLLIRLQHLWLRQRNKAKALVGELERIAFEDALTGLPNRNALIRQFEQNALHPPFAFVLIDIANFRAFNDTYGSETGDALLNAIAEILRDAIGDIPDAQVYRVGSDEFVLVMPNLSKRMAIERVETLIKRIHALTLEALTGHLSHIKSRAGLVYVDADRNQEHEKKDEKRCTFSACLMRADAALLAAKKQQHAVMDFDALESVRAPLLDHALGNFIDHAVRTGKGLVLHAQPIVSARDGHVLYHELLVRAKSADEHLIHPAELFEWINRHHLHRQLDHHVIRMAAELLASGQIPAGQGISLNLCEQTLLSADNLAALLAPLHPHVGKHPITIEVLESVLMTRLEGVRDLLTQLQAHGFHIALDDFGSGYASFRYLAQLPLNTVKLDRALLSMLDSPVERERELFVQLCHMLSEAEFRVIVEGVETTTQCAQLQQLSITGMQGYLFSRPVPQPVIQVDVPCPPSSP
ncbi:diguanylate cyclase (GGDEF) domain-containing protein [Sulfurivirga caldicuralii]|uniref:Diguanylate cyclase (GGDEF) domain-containing protein n=1 Tax=Sulfurivirga caldicuralii TaxID=364032 RepID=A0A1N6DWM0_9GAMM|nr:bifunctional diguanylate cyclase/phosphodiesterase [Sulfurivirga caldicuralii]SIN75094.1 diguanylate cyclase (GGDEF) domain-containing protein [Sulfurivirga caldicuralii]